MAVLRAGKEDRQGRNHIPGTIADELPKNMFLQDCSDDQNRQL